MVNVLWRCWLKFVCSGFYLQHRAYLWANAKRNEVPSMTTTQRRIVELVLVIATAAIVWALFWGDV